MDKDQLRAAVSRATGVMIDPADPVLVTAAITQLSFDEALAKLDRQVKAQADRMIAASAQTLGDAKKEAELLLTEGGEWAEGRIKAAGESAAAMVLADLQQETAKAERASRVAVRAAWGTAIFGLVTLSWWVGMTLASFR
jgi:hypothetical protein